VAEWSAQAAEAAAAAAEAARAAAATAREEAEGRLATHQANDEKRRQSQQQCDDCEIRLAAERQHRLQLEREVNRMRCEPYASAARPHDTNAGHECAPTAGGILS
jgi:hypothetical protein